MIPKAFYNVNLRRKHERQVHHLHIYTPSGTKSNKIVDLLNHQQPEIDSPYLPQALKKKWSYLVPPMGNFLQTSANLAQCYVLRLRWLFGDLNKIVTQPKNE